jgi:LacI family transcriptional regulator
VAKRPTVYDVAQAAGVSIATVSFAFRQPERVRASTRDKVLEAARELKYVPSASARGLAHGRTGALGIYSFDMMTEAITTDGLGHDDAKPGSHAVQTASDPAFADDAAAEDVQAFPLYMDEVQRGFELECARLGQALLIGRGPGNAGAGALDIASRVDGLAVFPSARSEELIAQLSLRLPVVAFAVPPSPGEAHRVRADNRGGAEALTEHLVTEHGITDIAFIGALEMADFVDRFDGMRRALERLGLPAPSQVLDPTRLVSDHPFAVVRALAAVGRLPRALVCASDQHAIELLKVLASLGVDVPGQVAVTGFDGVVAGRLCNPPLTTVRQPMEAMGRLAVTLLVDSLADGESPPLDLTLPTRMIVRGSCGCAA